MKTQKGAKKCYPDTEGWETMRFLFPKRVAEVEKALRHLDPTAPRPSRPRGDDDAIPSLFTYRSCLHKPPDVEVDQFENFCATVFVVEFLLRVRAFGIICCGSEKHRLDPCSSYDGDRAVCVQKEVKITVKHDSSSEKKKSEDHDEEEEDRHEDHDDVDSCLWQSGPESGRCWSPKFWRSPLSLAVLKAVLANLLNKNAADIDDADVTKFFSRDKDGRLMLDLPGRGRNGTDLMVPVAPPELSNNNARGTGNKKYWGNKKYSRCEEVPVN
eukprot:g9157.t1